MEIIKLNLGSRDRTIPGFKNMDIDAHPGVDFVGDVSDLSQFKNDSIAEIFASNILEHFPHVKTADVLNEWHRVLVPEGILYLSVPDFQRAAALYTACGMNAWLQNFICGDQVYATAFHYAIFDELSLDRIVKKANFSSCSRVEYFDFAAANDCSRLKSTWDGRPVSLNMVCVK